MINILAQAHMVNKTWTFTDDIPADTTLTELSHLGLGEVSLNVGFIDEESPVEFDDMSCTLVVTENGEEACNIVYPTTPIERTDLPYCFSYVFRAEPGTEIVASVSVTNAGETWSDSLTLVIDPEPVEEEVVE